MSKNVRWLNGELGRWVEDGIIERTQADEIRKLYAKPGPPVPWAPIVFSGIGAVIVGLGVILLFAYNWQKIPKFGKLGIIFAALAAAHGCGIWLHLRNTRLRALGEALTVLGTMFFGAGIWLVAQVYHMEEHYPNAFLAWGLGALALAWAMTSIPQAMIAGILFAVWAGAEAVEYGAPAHLAGPLIVVLLGPIAYLKRSRALLVVLILAFGASMGFASGACADELAFNVLMCIAAFLIAGGLLLRRHGDFPQAAPVLRVIGFAFYLFLLYLLTFPHLAEELLEARPAQSVGALLYWLPVVGAALTAWGAAVWPVLPLRGKRPRWDFRYDLLLVPVTLILCQVYVLFLDGGDDWGAAAPFNLVFLAHSVALMIAGCRKGLLRPTVIGSVLLAALAIARYVDLFESLVVRGLVFVVVGAGLFSVGILYARARRKQAEAST